MTESRGPYSFNRVLHDELRELRPEAPELDGFEAAPAWAPGEASETKTARDTNLRDLFERVGAMTNRGDGLSALCLSGGGIRSATFNLGVLQGLAQARLLERFDYLSSVSGGGYIAGWLKAWTRRKGTAAVMRDLTRARPDNPLAPEPNPVDSLREYSNYLTPRLGVFSPDTWTMAAIILRNLILNWLVILPVLAAAVMLPQAALLASYSEIPNELRTPLLAAAIGAAAVASYFVHSLRHLRDDSDPMTRHRRIVMGGLLPLLASAALLATALARTDTSGLPALHVLVFVFLWCVGLPVVGWSIHEPFWRIRNEGEWPVRDLVALVLSGLVGAAVLAFVSYTIQPWLILRPALYITFSLPILLSVYLLARSLFVAFSGVGEEEAARRRATDTIGTVGSGGDADREWWARFSGLVLLSAALWFVGCGLVLLGWHLVFRVAHDLVAPIFAAMGGIAGLIVGILGMSDQTGRAPDGSGPVASSLQERVLKFAAPVFVAVLFVLLAHGTVHLGRVFTGNPGVFPDIPTLADSQLRATTGDVLAFLAGALGLLALGAAMGAAVNVNRFSLHGFYRNRLVRAYIGASNPERNPDPFTGFDIRDNLKLHDLWANGGGDTTECRKPLLLINCTLNLVKGQQKLAWQQRKAESFSMSPFYCGNFFEGYRSSKEYGGPGGITLGTALTVSGAAANPNAGSHSSPAMTFLMTLFNARLGAWLGNPNRNGERTFTKSGPRWALRPLFFELFGQTNASFRYVNLSDGGHFDNLGLYEMVLRRCRFIVVSDAGQDGEEAFGDLGNAIRKVRIDFGIPVEFTEKIRIPPRDEVESAMFCAIGRIRYAAVDGEDAAEGTLLYFKPALHGRGDPIPYDVFSYARGSGTFPHEPTEDQWFSESQFESYRALGLHAVRQATRGIGGDTLPDLLEAVERYVKPVQTERQVQVHAIYGDFRAQTRE